MKQFIILTFLICSFQVEAQLSFNFAWKNEKIELLKYYPLGEKDSIQFSDLKCYLSNIELKGKGIKDYKLASSVHLIDGQDITSYILDSSIDTRNFNSISFTFGLDSIINTSGDLEGDLDPISGMYWAWNTGYIHYKIVGHSSMVATPSQLFDFHIGGYRKPNATYFNLDLPLIGSTIELDLYQLFNENINLNLSHQLVVPGKLAFELATVLKSSIRIK
jgi:hypothetical protein